MATGTQVPFTDPGGTPCCCESVSCPPTFDSAFWGSDANSSRGITEAQANLITLPSGAGAGIYGGGTFTGSFSGSYQLTATGGSPLITIVINSSAAVNTTAVTTTGCYAGGDASATGAPINFYGSNSTGSTLQVSGGSTSGNACPAKGTFVGISSISVRISIQLIQQSGVWKAWVSAFISVGSGFLRAIKTNCTTLQASGTGITRNAYSVGGGKSYTFLGQPCSTNGTLVNNFTSNYGVSSFQSGNLSVSGTVTFVASAP